MIGLYECKEKTLKGYYDKCQKLLKEFLHISFQHIQRTQNQEANRLAQSASGYRMFQEVLSSETSSDDWRVKIADYLRDSSRKVTRNICIVVKGRWTVTSACGSYNLGGSAIVIMQARWWHWHRYYFASGGKF